MWIVCGMFMLVGTEEKKHGLEECPGKKRWLQPAMIAVDILYLILSNAIYNFESLCGLLFLYFMITLLACVFVCFVNFLHFFVLYWTPRALFRLYIWTNSLILVWKSLMKIKTLSRSWKYNDIKNNTFWSFIRVQHNIHIVYM